MSTSNSSQIAMLAVFGALSLAGCNTAGTSGSSLETSFAPVPDIAPLPGSRPDIGEMSLAGAEEPEGTETGVPSPGAAIASVVSYAADALPEAVSVKAFTGSARERECLMRAMYFESNRSSRDGLLAVGSVVMNRLQSGRYAASVCGVVGQHRQFAPGVLSRRMQGDTTDLAALADAILAGKRHPKVEKAMHFHQAGLKFSYGNMHYVLVAGGNSFYEKRSRRRG